MSEPTTAAVPKPEDKQPEVTTAVEPSPETVVESSVPVPDAPKEGVKDEEPTKTEVPAVTNQAAEPSSASGPDPKESKDSDKPADGSPKDRPKSPSFLARLLKPLRTKGDKRKDKEKAPAPAAEEPAVPAEEPSPADAKPEDKPEEAPADPVKEVESAPAPAESEATVPQTTQEEPKNEEGHKEDKEDKVNPAKSALKMGRRISQRVMGAFSQTQRRSQADPPAKVDEEPPKIQKPAPVGPLENPAADSTPATADEPRKEETKESNEPPKIIDSTPAPVVATA